MENNILHKLGLSYPEDKIYLCLLRLHWANISTLSKETGVYRPTLYRVLPVLIEKNLVTKTQAGKRTLYVAEDPNVLHSFADEIKTELESALPDLSRLYEGSQKRPIIRFYEGKKAIQHIYENMMGESKKGDAYYRYESPRGDYKKFGRYYPNIYWKRATGPEGEIEKYVITNEETNKNRRIRLMRHSKAIPASFDSFDYNITQLIFKNKVAFIDFDTETATVIENQRFAEFQLKIFKMLFQKL